MKKQIINLVLILIAFGLPTVVSAQSYSFTTIDCPGESQTAAFAINDAGQIVGLVQDNPGGVGGPVHSFLLLDDGTCKVFDPPLGTGTSAAAGINARGEIVGVYTFPPSVAGHGYLLSKGTFTTIDYPGASCTNAQGINDSGTIVGGFTTPTCSNSPSHGYILRHGTFTQYDVPGAASTQLYGINSRGDLVGTYQLVFVPGGPFQGFLDRHGNITTINFPGATNTNPTKINNHGDIVGYYTDILGAQHGFTYIDGNFSTIDVPVTGAYHTNADGINDSGHLVGFYIFGVNEHGFEATPVPEP